MRFTLPSLACLAPLCLAPLCSTPLCLAPLFWASPAIAHPTSLVACPTGQVEEAREGTIFLFNGRYPEGFLVWCGTNVGLGGRFPYGGSGLAFGGWEAGVDGIMWDGEPAGARAALSVKAQVLEETATLPALSLGAMGVAIPQAAHALNLVFLVGTKTLAWRAAPLGTLTAGLGTAALRGATEAFTPTAPFPAGSRECLLLGYESPSLGPCVLDLDHIGGLQDYGGTNVMVNVLAMPGAHVALGCSFANDPATPPAPYCLFTTLFKVPGGKP